MQASPIYQVIPTKLRISSAVLLAAVIALTGFPGSNGAANAQEPVAPGSPDSVDAAENRLLYDEKAAQSIDGMLMCPVCPAETIDQAQVPLAKQMRRLVREKLAQGETREQILEYFADVYGRDILAAPSKSGFNLVAWTVPVVGILAALAAGFFVLRSMQAGSGTAGTTLTQEELGPYLQAVDRDLNITEGQVPEESGETGANGANGSPNG